MNRERRNNLILRVAVTAVILLLIPLCAWLSLHGSGQSALRFSELLSANSACPDPEGRFRDFIELHNEGDADADLSGWGLSDKPDKVKYRFPDGTTVPAGDYLVVWCDASAGAEEDAAPFSLAREGGETVILSDRRGAAVDQVTTLRAERNRSMVPDGAGGWTLCDTPTPGFENSAAGRAAYLAARSGGAAAVVLSEYMSGNTLFPAPDGQYCDWVELQNRGTADADLELWTLSDTAEREKYTFPAGTTVPAGGCLVVWCGTERTGFSLARAGGETLCLTDARGGIADRVETAALDKNRSMARSADGSWAVSETPTPGYENGEAGVRALREALGCADAQVLVSELMADNRCTLADAAGAFPDWAELWNAGERAVDLGGWWLSDDPENPLKWRIPALRLDPGGCALIFCDGRDASDGGEWHASFSLSAAGETVTLSDPLGTPVSTLRYEALAADESALALGDAAAPSPGYPNTPAGVLDFQSARETPAPLAIYEVMSANDSCLRQFGGAYYDWAELKNVGDAPLDLSGWSLTDDPAQMRRFVFPARSLAPGDCVTVLLCGADHGPVEGLAADFALDAAEDRLYLYDPSGVLRDYLRVAGLPYRHSLGRLDGENGCFLFDAPTPGADNTGGARGLTAAPTADLAPGVYDGVEHLTVALRGDGEIRYTTDGSVPTAESARYDGPIELTETAVLRARCFAPGLLPGPTATLNYVINEGHSLPVACLSLAPEDFNGAEGIYSNPGEHFEVWANLSFFEPDGSGGFSRDCGARLHGAGSRSLYAKKSMKVDFRPRYGGALDYDVFGDGAITGFDSLLLRGGDVMFGNVLLKDAMIARAAEDADTAALVLNARYAVLYVNGEYWGVYCLREAYSERYAADHLGCGEEEVTILQGPIGDDPTGLFRNLQQISRAWDGEAGAAWLESWLDVDSAIDWTIFEGFFSNMDIPGNVRYIRGGDGLWRYGLFDLDESLYEEQPSWSAVLSLSEQHGAVPRALANNPVLRDRLLRRLAALLQGELSAERLCARLEALTALLDPEMPRELERWGGGVYWEATTQRFLDWFRADRGEKAARDLAATLHLSPEEFAAYFPFYD